MIRYCPTVRSLEQEFKRECLREIQARAGPIARRHAEIALDRPDALDILGVAWEADLEAVPANAPEVAARYLRASPDARATWTPL